MRLDERCPFVWSDESAKAIACPLCGFEDASPNFRKLASIVRECPVRKLTRQLGWGDRVHWLLGLVGITPLRVAKIVAWSRGIKFGEELARRTCGGCRERRERLNQVGWRVKWRAGRLQWFFYEMARKIFCPPCRKPIAAPPSRQCQATRAGTTADRPV